MSEHRLTAKAAAQVAAIACTADGGCTDCAAKLLKQLRAAFPEHAKVFEDTFLQNFEYEIGPSA